MSAEDEFVATTVAKLIREGGNVMFTGEKQADGSWVLTITIRPPERPEGTPDAPKTA